MCIVLATLFLQIWAGTQKNGYHCDEGFSLLVASVKGELYYRVMADNPSPMWVDGVWLKNLTRLDPQDYGDFTSIKRLLRNIDGHPPLYYELLHHVQHWTGGAHSLWQGVSINIVANLICLPLLYGLGSRLFPSSQWPRYLAPALWGSCVIAIDLTIFIRHYCLLATFSTLATWIWVRWDGDHKQASLWAVFWTATLFTGGIMHYGIFPWMLSLIPLSLIYWKGRWKSQVGLVAASLVGFSLSRAWFPTTDHHLRYSPAFSADSALNLFLHGDFRKVWVNFDTFQGALLRELLYPEVVLLLLVSATLLLANRRFTKGPLWVIALQTVGFLIFATIIGQLPAKRYLAPCLPCLCLLVAGSICALPSRWQRIVGVLLLAVFGLRAFTGPLEHAYRGRVTPFDSSRPEGIIYVKGRSIEYRQWDVFQYVHPHQRYLVLKQPMLDGAVARSILTPRERVALDQEDGLQLRNRPYRH